MADLTVSTDVDNFMSETNDLLVAMGGTGANTAAGARTNLDVLAVGELEEVSENTSRNLANTDFGTLITYDTSAGARTLTIVAGLTQDRAFMVQLGTGGNDLTIAAGASVTILGGNVTLSNTDHVITFVHTGTLNTYRVFNKEAGQKQSAMLDDLGAVAAATAADEMLVTTGAGTWALESGATLRTSIGAVGTADTQTLTNKDLTSETNKIRFEKDVFIESPTNAENITMFKTNKAITISQVNAGLPNGSATPTVTLQIYHDTTLNGTTNSLVNSVAVTSTTGTNLTISDGTIPADSWVKIVTTGQGGTVPGLFLHFEGTED